MADKQNKGLGYIIPTLITGLKYAVHYGMPVVGEIKRHGRGMIPARWTKCSLRSANDRHIPEGTYFLHTEDGKVHHVKCESGQWQCLAPAI